MLVLIGCQQGGSASFDTDPTLLQDLMSEYNGTRVSEGLDPVTQGLDCNVWTVPTTTTEITGATGLVSVGLFLYTGTFSQQNEPVTVGLDVFPKSLQPVIQSWYIMKCTGVMGFTEDGWHEFRITADDGANLYVNGLVVNDDGLHAATTVLASKFLARGVVSFELDYLQGSGSEQLTVMMDGVSLPESQLFHCG